MDSKSKANIIKKFMRQNADYYRENKDYITKYNNKMLKVCSIIYMLILTAYGTFEYFLGSSTMLFHMYVGFGIFHLLFLICVFARTEQSQNNYIQTHIYCSFFEITVLSFFALEGVFPYPNQHALYVPIAIIVIVLVFDQGAKYIASMVVLYLLFYSVTAYLYKPWEVAANDIGIACATLIASSLAYIILQSLRMTQRENLNKLEYLSTIDALTGIYNKATIERLCAAYIADAENRKEKGSCALLVLDLDNFKYINDTYGHITGDKVLSQFAGKLKDVFYQKDFVGRFGGDEFLVMMSADSGALDKVEQKINSVIKNTGNIDIRVIREKISCSVGAVYVEDAATCEKSFEELFEIADQALYEAKKAGKGMYVVK